MKALESQVMCHNSQVVDRPRGSWRRGKFIGTSLIKIEPSWCLMLESAPVWVL